MKILIMILIVQIVVSNITSLPLKTILAHRKSREPTPSSLRNQETKTPTTNLHKLSTPLTFPTTSKNRNDFPVAKPASPFVPVAKPASPFVVLDYSVSGADEHDTATPLDMTQGALDVVKALKLKTPPSDNLIIPSNPASPSNPISPTTSLDVSYSKIELRRKEQKRKNLRSSQISSLKAFSVLLKMGPAHSKNPFPNRNKNLQSQLKDHNPKYLEPLPPILLMPPTASTNKTYPTHSLIKQHTTQNRQVNRKLAQLRRRRRMPLQNQLQQLRTSDIGKQRNRDKTQTHIQSKNDFQQLENKQTRQRNQSSPYRRLDYFHKLYNSHRHINSHPHQFISKETMNTSKRKLKQRSLSLNRNHDIETKHNQQKTQQQQINFPQKNISRPSLHDHNPSNQFGDQEKHRQPQRTHHPQQHNHHHLHHHHHHHHHHQQQQQLQQQQQQQQPQQPILSNQNNISNSSSIYHHRHLNRHHLVTSSTMALSLTTQQENATDRSPAIVPPQLQELRPSGWKSTSHRFFPDESLDFDNPFFMTAIVGDPHMMNKEIEVVIIVICAAGILGNVTILLCLLCVVERSSIHDFTFTSTIHITSTMILTVVLLRTFDPWIEHKIANKEFCWMEALLFYIFAITNMYTRVFAGIDRYFYLSKGIKYYQIMTTRITTTLIVVVWLLSAVAGSAFAYGDSKYNKVQFCTIQGFGLRYTSVELITLFTVPTISLTVIYGATLMAAMKHVSEIKATEIRIKNMILINDKMKRERRPTITRKFKKDKEENYEDELVKIVTLYHRLAKKARTESFSDHLLSNLTAYSSLDLQTLSTSSTVYPCDSPVPPGLTQSLSAQYDDIICTIVDTNVDGEGSQLCTAAECTFRKMQEEKKSENWFTSASDHAIRYFQTNPDKTDRRPSFNSCAISSDGSDDSFVYDDQAKFSPRLSCDPAPSHKKASFNIPERRLERTSMGMSKEPERISTNLSNQQERPSLRTSNQIGVNSKSRSGLKVTIEEDPRASKGGQDYFYENMKTLEPSSSGLDKVRSTSEDSTKRSALFISQSRDRRSHERRKWSTRRERLFSYCFCCHAFCPGKYFRKRRKTLHRMGTLKYDDYFHKPYFSTSTTTIAQLQEKYDDDFDLETIGRLSRFSYLLNMVKQLHQKTLAIRLVSVTKREALQNAVESRHRHRIIRVCCVIFLILFCNVGLCLPFSIMLLVGTTFQGAVLNDTIQNQILFLIVLMTFVLDPVIYGLMNSSFRIKIMARFRELRRRTKRLRGSDGGSGSQGSGARVSRVQTRRRSVGAQCQLHRPDFQ